MKSAGAHGFTRSRVPLIAMLALAAIGMAGCYGDDGKNGATGPTGPGSTIPGPTGPTGPTGPAAVVDPIATAQPESCVTCHGGAGGDHQSIYKDYLDAKTKSQYKISIEDVTGDGKAVNSTQTAAGVYTLSFEFKLTKNGLPYNDGTVGSSTGSLAGLQQKRFTIQAYFEGNQYPFQGQTNYTTSLGTVTFLGDGKYTASGTGAKWDPSTQAGWQAYGYVAAGVLETEGFTLYADVADDGLAFGTANNYVSTAVVSGCEACHGAPYLKHGYRAAVVDGLKDFAACKECHYDDRTGGHLDWQQMVDQPYQWATGVAAGSGQVRVQGQRDAGHAPDACHGVPVPHVHGELHDLPQGQARQDPDRCELQGRHVQELPCGRRQGRVGRCPAGHYGAEVQPAEARAGTDGTVGQVWNGLVPHDQRALRRLPQGGRRRLDVQDVPQRLRRADLQRVGPAVCRPQQGHDRLRDADRQRAGRQVQLGQCQHRPRR